MGQWNNVYGPCDVMMRRIDCVSLCVLFEMIDQYERRYINLRQKEIRGNEIQWKFIWEAKSIARWRKENRMQLVNNNWSIVHWLIIRSWFSLCKSFFSRTFVRISRIEKLINSWKWHPIENWSTCFLRRFTMHRCIVAQTMVAWRLAMEEQGMEVSGRAGRKKIVLGRSRWKAWHIQTVIVLETRRRRTQEKVLYSQSKFLSTVLTSRYEWSSSRLIHYALFSILLFEDESFVCLSSSELNVIHVSSDSALALNSPTGRDEERVNGIWTSGMYPVRTMQRKQSVGNVDKFPLTGDFLHDHFSLSSPCHRSGSTADCSPSTIFIRWHD